LVCVGLDPVLEKIPPHLEKVENPTYHFLREIIEATKDYVAAYKPNFAYFEALGPEGLLTLQKVIQGIPKDIAIIGDAKRGDVGHSSAMYAKAIFETFQCDAVTVSPYQGFDALEPFFNYSDKGTIVLCLTSNPGAADFQLPEDLFLRVARKVGEWNVSKNCGLVVGATRPEQIGAIREESGPMPYLIPGVGAQGGDLEQTLRFVEDGTSFPCLINASRSILYASSGSDFAEAAHRSAQTLRDQINSFRKTASNA